jgi:predicted phage terminase large subunit-like protein
MTSKRQLLNLALRNEFSCFAQRTVQTVSTSEPYQHNWHLDVMAHYLQLVANGDINRLIINLPPRYLKSLFASVALPAFLLGRDPRTRIICASHSAELAFKHSRDCRAVMETGWYKQLFHQTRLDRSKIAQEEITTTQGGFRLATSIAGPLTGRGGGYLIIDDPLKADDAYSDARRTTVNEWLPSTALTRLDNKMSGAAIIVMQRLHDDDLTGHLIQSGADYTLLNLPAIAGADQWFDLGNGRIVGRNKGEALFPEREPLELLHQIRMEVGTHNFEAHFQQNPVPLTGGLIQRSWLKPYRKTPEKEANDIIVQSWDNASKGDEVHDYTVCTTWLRRGSDHYLLDVRHVQIGFPQQLKLISELHDQFSADVVLIEDKGSGTDLIQLLGDEGRIRPIGIVPEGDKIIRMLAQTPKMESGHVFIPEDAPWLDDFIRELLQFPRGKYDDQIDSVSQYLGWAGGQMEDLSGMRISHGSMAEQGFIWREGY